MFLKNRALLNALANGSPLPKKLLSHQAKALLYLMHFLVNGDIPISSHTFTKLKKKNGLKKLQLGLESKTAFMALLKLDLHKKNQFLHKLKVDWSDLVKPILTQT